MLKNNTDLFLGIDLGTSGCRACIINADEHVIAESHSLLPEKTTQTTESWKNALLEALNRLKPQSILSSIKGISFDATSSTVFFSSPQGIPFTDILFYDDTRSSQEAEKIEQAAPTNTASKNSTSSLAKVLWLLQYQKPVSEFVLMHQADWLLFFLTGIHCGITDENNVLKLGYDAQKKIWPHWLKDLLKNNQSLLPTVVSPGKRIGHISVELADSTGLPTSASVFTGTTDSIAACLSAGAKNNGDAITSLGSTLVLKIVSDTPIFNSKYGIYSHRYGHRWLVGGASNSGGAALSQHFKENDLVRLSDKIIAEYPSPYHFYPLPSTGERFPIHDPHQQSRVSPRPKNAVDFLHGLLESIAQIEKEGYLLLEKLGAPQPKKITTVGGGASNATWQQIRERVLSKTITAAQHTEAAYGSALLAKKGFYSEL